MIINYGIIYKIECTVTNKVYIGQTTQKNFKKRMYRHRTDKIDTHLYRARDLYGWDSFKITIVEDKISLDNGTQLLDEREIFWISYYDSFNNGYNSTKGGRGGDTYSKKTGKDLEKLKEALKNRPVKLKKKKLKKDKILEKEKLKKDKILEKEKLKKDKILEKEKLLKREKLYTDFENFLRQNNRLPKSNKTTESNLYWFYRKRARKNEERILLIINKYLPNTKIRKRSKLIIKNTITGELLEFSTLTLCGNYFKVSPTAIRNWIENKSIKNNWQF